MFKFKNKIFMIICFVQLFLATKIRIFGGFQPNRRELPQFGRGGHLGVKKIFFAFLDELDHV